MRFYCQPKAPWFWGFGAKGLGPGLDNNMKIECTIHKYHRQKDRRTDDRVTA